MPIVEGEAMTARRMPLHDRLAELREEAQAALPEAQCAGRVRAGEGAGR
jgi:hypothetical protein